MSHAFDRTEQHWSNGKPTLFRRAVCTCGYQTLGFETNEAAKEALATYHLRQKEANP